MPTLNITVKGTVLYTTQVPHIADNDSLNVPIDAYLGLAEFKQAEQPVKTYAQGYTDGLAASDSWAKALTEKQAEQKPVGYTAQSVIDWLSSNERTDFAYSNINLHKKPTDNDLAPLYTTPVRTKDLTDSEIDFMGEDMVGEEPSYEELRRFARAVIAKDREMNK